MAHQDYKEARQPRSKGKIISEMRLKKADGGGHVVEHHYSEDGMQYHKPATHVFGADEGSAMMSHVAKHMGVTTREEGMEEDAETGGSASDS